MDAATIVLPAPPAESRRPQLPLLAAIVPVLAGVVLWLITGSMFALCFAALGPLMLVASFLDGIRVRRKERRRNEAQADAAWRRAEAERERLHVEEHAERWRRSPDASRCVAEPPLRGHAPVSAQTPVVIGRGTVRSRVQVSGGDDERSRAFREQAERLADAPITAELGGGICVRAPETTAQAVARALIVQLCLRFGAGQLSVVGDGVHAWRLGELPHAGRRRAPFRLGLGTVEEPVDAVICIREPGEEPPEGVTTVLDCTVPARALVRVADGTSRALAAEALSAQQAQALAAQMSGRADAAPEVPDLLSFAELPPFAPSGRGSGLSATFGRGERGDLSVDLVEDGPHAIVTGMTGTGKSELLTSWVAAIAAAHSPDEVAFVLVDFKGGTAFDPLRVLPHVVAVVTDLDADGARRGVGSLTAELRRREAALAQTGARDIRGCPSLARLVVVIDEFAAMLQEHPDLGQIFIDVAARGRALGMHLVLGTQRASGVIRDALAANCPLRISLRMAETADSRFVIGCDAAAVLPGGPDSRGLAFVRRPRDAQAHATRIALTGAEDLSALADRWSGATPQQSPWLPPLPDRVAVPDETALTPGVLAPGAAVLGLADEPERQRQPWITLGDGDGLAILGGTGSGKSTAIAMLAVQLPGAVVIPDDPEEAWDAVAELASGRHGPVLCDDLDVLAGAYPTDHAQLFLSRWETILRSPETVVVTMARAAGPLARLIDALPRRALLRMGSKVEHVTAGGEPAQFHRNRPAGRAWLDEREVQLCWAAPRPRAEAEPVPRWRPSQPTAGVITTAVGATASRLRAAHPSYEVVPLSLLLQQLAESPDEIRPAARIIVADPEEWRARWTQVQGIRTSGEMVVAAECATELRQLVGVRDPPPFARMHADRAWSVEPGRRPRRVLLG